MTIGIENLKAGIVSAVGIICQGIHLAKKAGVIAEEAKDLQFDEMVALIILAATEEGPKIVSAIKGA